jgi:phosphohistidine phosphatase
MKKLVLIRHAKSSWEFNLEDRDRPLTKKGIKRIKQMVMHNPEIFSSSEIIFSSTANRATHTTSILVNSLFISFKIVNLVEDLYTFKVSKLIHFLKRLSDNYESVICVGHNPAFTDAVSYFSNTELDYLPTAAWAKLEFEQSKWVNIADGTLTLGIPKKNLK